MAKKATIYTLDPVYLNNQRKIAKYLVSKDKGNFIRQNHGYIKLVPNNLFSVESELINNFLRIPYDHNFMTIKKL